METSESAIFAFRFGYGLPSASGFASAESMMQQLKDADPVPVRLREQISSPRLIEIGKEFLEVGVSSGSERDEKRRVLVITRNNYYQRDCHDRVAAAVESRFPLFERLVSFWS